MAQQSSSAHFWLIFCNVVTSYRAVTTVAADLTANLPSWNMPKLDEHNSLRQACCLLAEHIIVLLLWNNFQQTITLLWGSLYTGKIIKLINYDIFFHFQLFVQESQLWQFCCWLKVQIHGSNCTKVKVNTKALHRFILPQGANLQIALIPLKWIDFAPY